MSSEIDELINEIIKQKPQYTKQDIEALIAAKKAKVGASYLTDKGAVFLVANECGATIGKPIKTEVSIKDLYAGANEVTLEARLLSVAPIRRYTRQDGGQGMLRVLTIYDSPSHTASAKLWGEKATLPGIDELRPGDFVRIIKAYVKEDRDGSLAVHVGSNSAVEPVASPQSEIPSLDAITKDVSGLSEDAQQSNLAVSGTLQGEISVMEYTRQQTGDTATALKMRLLGSNGTARRVVLWGKGRESIPKKITAASPKVRLLGVYTRMTEQQGLEIHGNESTSMEIEGSGSIDAGGSDSIDPIVVRILAKPEPPQGGSRQAILGVDSSKRLYTIADTGHISGAYKEGEIVECMPAQIHGAAVTIDSSSFIRGVGEADSAATLPTMADVIVPILDARPGDGGGGGSSLYCIECIVLNPPDKREIQTKSGEVIYLSEMVVGDGSGEAVIKAWRNHTRLLDECEMGTKYVVTGVRAQQGMGGVDLTLTEYSVLRKVATLPDGETPGGGGDAGGSSGSSSDSSPDSPPAYDDDVGSGDASRDYDQ